MAKETPLEKMSYEEAFAELESIVGKLEEADQPLDEAMALFERGQSLAKHCGDLLDKAELKVQELSEDGQLSELE
ncbi:MAG: exodeoxyribonuclease VII small subunit [Anaerolineae bacterium]|nr:exodeoxyribonuclease VII small subunit [Anaerolineae bacterium]